MKVEMKSEKELSRSAIKFDSRKYMMVFALIGIWIIFTVLSTGTYIMPRNMSNLFRQSVFTAVLAVGMLNVILLGEIDLSVGSIAGLCGGMLAILNVWSGVPILLAIVITLILGFVLGLWNGWWVAYRGVPAFIVTLAGMLVFRGVLLGMTDGITISPLDPALGIIGKEFLPGYVGIILGAVCILGALYFQWSARFKRKAQLLDVPALSIDIAKSVLMVLLIGGFVALMNAYQGIPTPLIIVLVLFLIFNFVLNRTVFGRRIYAIGGNKMASRLAGINIKKTTMIVFSLNGLIAAIAGIFLTSRLDSAAVNAGTSAEMDAIAACIVGGTSMMGGIGTLPGAIIGALVMASIDNGMSLLDAPSFYQTIVKGLVLLIAVWFDMSRKKDK